jgi:hypothetical protein
MCEPLAPNLVCQILGKTSSPVDCQLSKILYLNCLTYLKCHPYQIASSPIPLGPLSGVSVLVIVEVPVLRVSVCLGKVVIMLS